MKSLLVPVEDTDRMTSALETARVFAAQHDARVDGVALRLNQFQAVGAEPIVAVTLPTSGTDDADLAQRARKRFDAFVTGHGLAQTFRWRGGDPIDDAEFGALSRVYDLIVVGRPGAPEPACRMTTFEAALFESGRPLLIAPPETPETIGQHVVISWNRSTEAAHTVAAALPLIQKAEQVTILTVETVLAPGPDGDELRNYLAVHGIDAKLQTETGKFAGPGEAILNATRELGGDLLIKSAYTQSRLRQMIFGGATSQILAQADMPVFMAN